MLNDAIFATACLAMALQNKLQVDLSVCNMSSLQLISQPFGFATTAQGLLFFLENCLETLEKKSIGSYRSHVTRCNHWLQLAMVSKQSILSLQKIEPCSTLCNICNPKNVA